MTIEEIQKYADEKGMLKKGAADMGERLEADYKDGSVDEMIAGMICADIDRSSEYWKGFCKLLAERREERARR